MINGAFGSITLYADGIYTYLIDESNVAVQALRTNSQTLSDTFTYTIRDTAGLESTTQLVITIRGANDARVADAASFVTHEDVSEFAGSLTSNDVDHGDGATYTLIQGPTSGIFQLDPDGTFRFTPGAAFQDLALGESRQVTFRYRVTDHAGAWDEQVVSLEVTGRNDSVSVLDDAISTGESASITVDVLANDLDIDAGDLVSLIGARLVQGVGALSWGNAGITFTPGPAYEALAPGESSLVRIEYDVVDLIGVQVSGYLEITILGERDQLQVSVSDQVIREDGIAGIPILIERIDTNGEQVVSVRLNGLPAGAVLQDGEGRVHVAGGSQAIELMGWDWSTLQVRPPASFSGNIALQVDVTSDAPTDAVRVAQWSIEIEPVADAAVLGFESAEGLRGDWIPLVIRVNQVDGDGSESLQLRVRGIPTGAILTDGARLWTSAGPHEWLDLQSWSLSDLALRVMSNGGPIVPLVWEATTTELANGDRFVTTGVQEVVTIDVPPFAFVVTDNSAVQGDAIGISEVAAVSSPGVQDDAVPVVPIEESDGGGRTRRTSLGDEDPEGLEALDRLKHELDEHELQHFGAGQHEELEMDVERLMRGLLEWEGDARFDRLHDDGLAREIRGEVHSDTQWEQLQLTHHEMQDQAGVATELSWFWGWLRTLGVVRERDEMRQRIREEQEDRRRG